MPLLTIGISHHTAPIEVRERVALAAEDYPRRLDSLMQIEGVEEAMLLATCNRTEVYCQGQGLTPRALLDWIHAAWDVKGERLDASFYHYYDAEAVRHLIRVAGGLDSLVLGETQILGQLKEAWQQAREFGAAGSLLDRLCQHAVTAAKAIRARSGIGEEPVSVAYTVIVLARQLFSDLESRRVLLIGAGDMIALCGRYMKQKGVTQLKIANRDLSRATRLANQLGATPIPLSGLEAALPEADILITSTASSRPILTADAVRQALSRRRHRPMFMVDIAVPRDIDPAVARLNDVYLYTIDDLQQVVDENLGKRGSAAENAETDVEAAVGEFIRWMNGSQAADSLKLMRERAHAHSRELVDRAIRRLEAGHDPQAVLEQLGSTLTNRILHAPSKHLRRAAEDNDLEVLAMINRIFSPADDGDDEEELRDQDEQPDSGGQAGGRRSEAR